MIEKLYEEYFRRRLTLYKNSAVKAASELRFVGYNWEGITEAVREILERERLEFFFNDIKAALNKYWKENNLKCSGVNSNAQNRVVSLSFKMHLGKILGSSEESRKEIFKYNIILTVIHLLEGKTNELFLDFENLNDVLKECPFNKIEKINLLSEIARLNLALYKSGDYEMPFDIRNLETTRCSKIAKFFIETVAGVYAYKDIKEINSIINRQIRKKMQKITAANPVNLDKYMEDFKIISDIENIKLDTLEEKEKLKHALENMGFSDLYFVLEKKYQSKKHKLEANLVQPISSPIRKSPVAKKTEALSLSKRESNNLYKRIQEVYDFSNNQCLTALKTDEIIAYTVDLIRIGANENTIKKFIIAAKKKLKATPTLYYQDILDRINKLNIESKNPEDLENLKIIIGDLLTIKQNKEDYEELLSMAKEYLDLIEFNQQDLYTYEINEALVQLRKTNE